VEVASTAWVDVLPLEPPVLEPPVGVLPQLAVAVPSRPIPLPQAVIGALTGTSTPPALLPVVLPALLPELVGPAQVAEAWPSRPTPLPQAVIGAVIGTSASVPEPAVEPAGAATRQPADGRPTALPHTVTGAVTGTLINDRCAGELVPPEPLAPVVQPAEALPSRPTPLPHTVTGAVTGALITERRAAAVPLAGLLVVSVPVLVCRPPST